MNAVYIPGLIYYQIFCLGQLLGGSFFILVCYKSPLKQFLVAVFNKNRIVETSRRQIIFTYVIVGFMVLLGAIFAVTIIFSGVMFEILSNPLYYRNTYTGLKTILLSVAVFYFIIYITFHRTSYLSLVGYSCFIMYIHLYLYLVFFNSEVTPYLFCSIAFFCIIVFIWLTIIPVC